MPAMLHHTASSCTGASAPSRRVEIMLMDYQASCLTKKKKRIITLNEKGEISLIHV